MRNFKEEFELFNISEKLKQEFKCFETSLENSKKIEKNSSLETLITKDEKIIKRIKGEN